MSTAEWSPDLESFTRRGTILLYGIMTVALGSLLLLASVGAWLPILLAATAVVTPCLVVLWRREEANLFVVLASFVLIAGYASGIQWYEVAYGLYFSIFLVTWFLRRAYLRRVRILSASEDAAVLVFGVYVVVSVSWSLLLGARFADIFGELLVLAMLAFYFPAKLACLEDPEKSLRRFTLLFVWFALFVFTRNLVTYWQGLNSAEYLFEIVRGRVALNEILVTMPALAGLVFLIHARHQRERLAALFVSLISFAGLVITQSRGYWIAFAFGVLALIVLVEKRQRRRLIGVGALGIASVTMVAALLLPKMFDLIVLGIVDRVSTIGTALSTDISMVNRLYETSALWDKIKLNPILGYGTGARYQYWNLTFEYTIDYAFVHNVLAGLWFKYGLFGLFLVLFVWVRSIWSGIRLYRMKRVSTAARVIGLSIAVCLVAEFPVANTSNPFLIADGVLVFALFSGMASGLRQYYLQRDAV